MLENMISAGRWGGMNEEKKQALKEELDALSSSMGIRDGDISAALQKFYIWHGIDLIHHLDTLMGQKHISNEPARKALLALCDRTASELPAVESVRTALSGLKDEELEILEPYIEDYAYYCTHKKMRPTGVFTE
jgi:hypothetical protein